MSLQSRLRVAWLVALGAGTVLASAATIERFGLSHSTLGAANIVTSSSISGFAVNNLGTNNEDGVATELGATDSGVFFFPNAEYLDSGYAMTAHAYGSVNGESNRPIGTVHGLHTDYGTFYASADFSTLGATSATFQVWLGNVLRFESTGDSSEAVGIYADTGAPPRVNPWWRQRNGEYGASFEFKSPVPLAPPGCHTPDCPLAGDRIFIRPNGATAGVDHVSRLEVFGGGGLPTFFLDQMQLGMFGNSHTLLEKGTFLARPGSLQVTNIPSGWENGGGTLVEFGQASRAQVDLLPLQIAMPDTNDVHAQVELSAIRTRVNWYTAGESLRLQNSNGVLHLWPNLYSDDGVVSAQVFSNNVLVGSGTFNDEQSVRIEGGPRLVSVAASADTLAGPNSFSLRFDTNATFTFSNGVALVGNRVAVTGLSGGGFADVKALGLLVRDLPSFTIVGESAEFETPRLEIVRAGGRFFARWMDPARAYGLESKTNLNSSFSDAGLTPSYTNGVATAELGPDGGFFRLRRDSITD